MEAAILAALQKLPTYHEDRGAEGKLEQLTVIAQAIDAASRLKSPVPRDEMRGMLITIAFHESTLSLRIHAGNCKPKECDFGKARTSWQIHKNWFISEDVYERMVGLGLESTTLAATEAANALSRAWRYCSRWDGNKIAMALTAYAGRGCNPENWAGVVPRMTTYNKVMRTLKPPAPKKRGASLDRGQLIQLFLEPARLPERYEQQDDTEYADCWVTLVCSERNEQGREHRRQVDGFGSVFHA